MTSFDRLNRRRLVQAGAATAAAAGIGSKAALAAPSSSSRSRQAAAQDVTEVKALMWSNGPVIDGHFDDRVAAFNEAHADSIKVNLEFLPYDQYWQKLQLAYASGGDLYDVYFWDVQAYGHFKNGLLKNLQPLIDASGALDPAEYPVDHFDVWRLDGENMYAMPENFQTFALYYNKDLFDADGLEYPTDQWTWDDAIAAATTLTKRDGDRVNQWGMNLGNLAVWWGLQTISWARGDAFFDQQLEPTKFQFSNPINVETLDFIRALVNDAQIAPKPSVASQQSDITGFASGRVGLVLEGSWSISGFAELPFNWGLTTSPLTDGNRVVPYWLGGWVIAEKSEVADAAFEWARWSSDEYQEQMAVERDWIPIKNSVRAGDAVTEGMPEGYREVIDALDSARIGDVYSENTQQIWVEAFDPGLTSLLEENRDPAEVAAEIDSKANELLAG